MALVKTSMLLFNRNVISIFNIPLEKDDIAYCFQKYKQIYMQKLVVNLICSFFLNVDSNILLKHSIKISKGAKIRNRHYQVRHLTKDRQLFIIVRKMEEIFH